MHAQQKRSDRIISFNPCPDEKGTERLTWGPPVWERSGFNPCPDEKGTERAQKKATAPKDNRLVSILILTKRGLKAHFPTFTPSHLLLVSILAPTKRGLKAHFPTFTPSHLPCPDEKRTESSLSHFHPLSPASCFNPCPDEKGTERAQKKATAPKDNRLVSIRSKHYVVKWSPVALGKGRHSMKVYLLTPLTRGDGKMPPLSDPLLRGLRHPDEVGIFQSCPFAGLCLP